ncbi:MAG: phosphotriesterase family protein [Halanaerobiales bacterium]
MVTVLDEEISFNNLGITLPHEHLTIDLSALKNDEDAKLSRERVEKSLKKAKKYGVETLIDLTNIGMGRDILTIKKIRDKLNINIMASTGFYKEPFLPEWTVKKSVDELAQIMIDDIEKGIDDTDLKASVIGEIGSGREFTDLEKKIFKAAAAAQKQTNCPLITHLTLGKLGLEQIDFLLKQGVDLSQVVLSHVSLSDDLDYILELAKSGVFLGLDTIGKLQYQSNEFRLKLIDSLMEAGYSGQILLSMDITRNSQIDQYGYQYLFEKFIPQLKSIGLNQTNINKLLIDNPKKLFCNYT